MNVDSEPNWAFKIMAKIHDNPFRWRLSNPYRTLLAAGLRPGQKVLEIGCGPGFFTIPAAKIVGKEGIIYANDIHPLAIGRVKEKAKKENLGNIRPVLADARRSGLPNQALDLAFLFGIIHRIDESFHNLLKELFRVLRSNGILSIAKSRLPRKKLIEAVEKERFSYLNYKKGIVLFVKNPPS